MLLCAEGVFFVTQNKALIGQKLGFCIIIEPEEEKSTAIEYGIKENQTAVRLCKKCVYRLWLRLYLQRVYFKIPAAAVHTAPGQRQGTFWKEK